MTQPLTHAVFDAIRSRQSCRRFTDEAVTRAQVETLLEVARHAPSGSNIQPWQVHVVSGATKAGLSRAILDDLEAQPERGAREYQYYPVEWFEPYLARRRACGWGLYSSLNIARGEDARMKAQRSRNYTFFDAPVGLFFTINRRLEVGSFMDVGMFLQSVMVAARGMGLHTCAQAAFANYHEVIRPFVNMADDELLICGLAVGYGDMNAPENVWRPDRAPVEEFTTWHDM